MEVVQGIWHEKARNRWRVKVFKDGELYHRSYHHDYQAALVTWTEIHKEIVNPRAASLRMQSNSVIDQFLRQPLPGAGEVT